MRKIIDESFGKKNRRHKRDLVSLLLYISVNVAALITLTALIFIIAYILIKGIPYLSTDLFAWEYTTENVSLLPALINTILMTILSLAVAVPVGVGSAIYLTEYAGRGNRLVSIIRITAETLSGIPSIVYGLFGSIFFVSLCGFGLSLLSGALTLAIMILPLIMRSTEEALIAVPDMYREGSFGLGAGKLRTVFKILLPCAMPGIISGIILAIGRIVGESAALIFTAGTIASVAKNVFSSTRTLSVHMYALSGEGLYINQTYATAVMLLVLVIVINALSELVAKKLGGNDE